MNTNPLSIDDATLTAYLAGELAPGESAELERAIAADPRLAAVLDETRRLWNMASKRHQWDIEKLWHVFATRTSRAQVTPTRTRPKQPVERVANQTPWRRLWYTATSIAMVAAVLMIGTRDIRSHSVPVPVSTYTTGNGQRATITLPDGNTVALNVASRLDVPVNYLNGDHTLRLRAGEALFSITHQTGTPLTVLTSTVPIRVLGTSFVVRHYASDSAVTVAVQQGKVSVQSTVLAANQETVVDHSGVAAVHPASSGIFSFTIGILTLEDMPLPAAIVELNRWYDADIRLGDPVLATQRMKGKFVMGSLADLSGILDLTFNVRVVRDGRVLTLYPR